MASDMPEPNAGEYANPVPPAVRRQVERAEELVRQMSAPVEPPVPEPELPSADPPVPEPAPAPAPAPPVTDWEQRYRTLQGKYDSEMPQMRAQLAALQEVVINLRAQPAAPTPAPEPAHTTTVVSDADVEQYGQDLIDAARRWAMTEVQPRLAHLERQLGDLRQQTKKVETSSSQHTIMATLDADPALAGKWREINTDEKFLAWLAQTDYLAGRTRKNMLDEAYASGDAVRTGAFFKAYLAEHTAAPQAPAAPVQTPAEPVADRLPLETLAAPGRPSGPAPDGAPLEKRLWTAKEIAAFYRDRALGRYAGREAESIRLERDLISAAAEGRVR